MKLDTIPINYVNALLSAASTKGLDINALLHAVHIDPSLITNPKARISAENFTVLTNMVVDGLNDEFGGFLPTPAPKDTFALLCSACILDGSIPFATPSTLARIICSKP